MEVIGVSSYYVHTKTDDEGDYEVHVSDCSWLPNEENRKYLGNFNNCKEAVTEARKYFSPVNGCKHCCKLCHTS